MKKHYFIDYENVREHGLSGLSGLNGDCYVHLMFTSNANKISLDSLVNLNGAHVEIMKTPAGKQSLDMQLISYMGFIIGRELGEENEYIIVSKDKGYKNSEIFWNSNSSVKGRVLIRPRIAEPEAEQKVQEETVPALPAEPEKEKITDTAAVVESEEKPVAQPEEAAPVQERRPQTARRTRRGKKTSAQKQTEPAAAAVAPAVQTAAEPAADEAVPAAPAPAPAEPQESKEHSPEELSRRELNSKLMKALAETGMDNKMVGQIASLCVKLSGKENHKQAIYRGIISKLGQKKGLETYHIIKGII